MENFVKPVLKLGVTGGIGSGKSSVCKVFSTLGIPIFYADVAAKEIMDTDIEIMNKINSITGKDLYTNGTLDRTELARLIFNNGDILTQVNSLIHPLVFSTFKIWADIQKAPYVIMEAAILFESGGQKHVDKVLTVIAPVEQRVERIVNRNKLTREQVMERVKNQMDDASRIKLSDYVVYNSENDMIIPLVLKIHEELINMINNQI